MCLPAAAAYFCDMITVRTCLAFAICLLMVGCYRLSPDEEKVIGTWEFAGSGTTGRVVFRRDHTVVDLFPENKKPNARWEAVASGKWWLEGDTIVTDERALLRASPDETPFPRRVTRMKVRDFGKGRTVREEIREPLQRVKPWWQFW